MLINTPGQCENNFEIYSFLAELETTLGRGLPENELFMFVHGTADCRLPPVQGKQIAQIKQIILKKKSIKNYVKSLISRVNYY